MSVSHGVISRATKPPDYPECQQCVEGTHCECHGELCEHWCDKCELPSLDQFIGDGWVRIQCSECGSIWSDDPCP